MQRRTRDQMKGTTSPLSGDGRSSCPLAVPRGAESSWKDFPPPPLPLGTLQGHGHHWRGSRALRSPPAKSSPPQLGERRRRSRRRRPKGERVSAGGLAEGAEFSVVRTVPSRVSEQIIAAIQWSRTAAFLDGGTHPLAETLTIVEALSCSRNF